MDGLDENHIRWIRLGKSYWYGNKKDDGEGKPEDRICPVTAFVVAKVQKRNMKIDYFEVPTWGFNGRRIGRCEWSLPFMIAEEYTSDDCFAQSGTTRDNLEVRLLLLAHSLDDGHTGAHFFPPDAAQDQNSVLVVPRILSPRPTRASGDPPTLPEPDSKGTITVVVTFVNETGVSGIKPIDLGLNLQANLPWDDDYDHFVKWLLDKHDKVLYGSIRKYLNRKIGNTAEGVSMSGSFLRSNDLLICICGTTIRTSSRRRGCVLR